MRKLTLTEFMTLDGVVQSPGDPTRTRAAASPRAPSLRTPRPRAHRARAHPDPQGGGRCHPHALPGPALNAAFPRLLLPGECRCSGVSRICKRRVGVKEI